MPRVSRLIHKFSPNILKYGKRLGHKSSAQTPQPVASAQDKFIALPPAEAKSTKNPFTALPDELTLCIMSFLPAPALARVSRIDRYFNDMSLDAALIANRSDALEVPSMGPALTRQNHVDRTRAVALYEKYYVCSPLAASRLGELHSSNGSSFYRFHREPSANGLIKWHSRTIVPGALKRSDAPAFSQSLGTPERVCEAFLALTRDEVFHIHAWKDGLVSVDVWDRSSEWDRRESLCHMQRLQVGGLVSLYAGDHAVGALRRDAHGIKLIRIARARRIAAEF